jgi:1-acyl-sn-glycerol-3-phosphate acyltransferase
MTDRPSSRRQRARTDSPAAADAASGTLRGSALNGSTVNGSTLKAVPVKKALPVKKTMPVNGTPVSARPVAKEAVVRQAAVREAGTKKAAARRAVANKAVPTKAAPTKAVPTKAVPKEAAAKKAVAKKADANRVGRDRAGRPPDVWDERVAGVLGFLRRRLTGQYEVDEFGFDRQLTEALVHPPLRVLYQRYFRVEASGVENLPTDGPALLVANHSGTVPMDALMLSMAVHDETPGRRHLRLLGADLVFRIPVLSELARKAGSTLACNPDAERLMRAGEYVGVFPEGFKGIGKPYRDRYKLQRFGRGGFVSAALKTSTPIVPVSIVGAEEIYPIVANLKPLAQMTGLPFVPVTPLFPWLGPLGMLPLPSKWLIEFGAPISTEQYADEPDDPIVVFNLADQVRETIQQTLHTLLERRPDPFS